MKRNILLILCGVVLFLFITVTAFIWYDLFYRSSQNVESITTLQVHLEKETKTIQETDALPISKDQALANVSPYVFSVDNTGDKTGIYKILLEEPALKDDSNYQSKNLLTRAQLEYQLILNGRLVKSGMLSDIKNNILDERAIEKGKKNRYELRIYVSDKAVDSSWQNKYYHYKVTIQTRED